MNKKTTRKFRISVRTFLLIVAFGAAWIGISVDKLSKHNFANKKVREVGAIQLNQFEDPIGPNWLYGVQAGDVPNNGYFPRWFSNWFCMVGFTDCSIKDLNEDSEVWNHLTCLQNLNQLSISNSTPPPGWLKRFDRGRLRRLYIEATRITKEDMRALARFSNLELLSFSESQLEQDCLLRSLANNDGLKYLFLYDTGISDDTKTQLQNLLPNCEIQTEMDSISISTLPASIEQ